MLLSEPKFATLSEIFADTPATSTRSSSTLALFRRLLSLAETQTETPENSLASAFLIFSFIGTASSFLAFAILAEKHNISTEIRGKKAFYYLGGLTEGGETILLLLAMVIWPSYFIFMAFGFGLLCWVTTITRIYAAYRQFSN